MIWVPMMMYVEGMDLELVIVERESLNLNLLDLERLREFKKDFLWAWTIRSSERAPLVFVWRDFEAASVISNSCPQLLVLQQSTNNGLQPRCPKTYVLAFLPAAAQTTRPLSCGQNEAY